MSTSIDYYIASKDLYRLLDELDITVPGIGYNELVYKRNKFRKIELVDLIPDYDVRMTTLVSVEEHFDICLPEYDDINILDILNAIHEEHDI